MSYYYLYRQTDLYGDDDIDTSEIFVFYAGLWETFYIISSDEISEDLIKEMKK